ncbi:hypothetical protein [Paratractidigestivibacter sp.]|uniref:hypothetical protein n=1 Tax=Paratractidigestivibacter sp. TaxID=2847316 RepID=UPI002AC8B16E|nr:hypothetical protein [Paratractidigestivibacter sp.]
MSNVFLDAARGVSDKTSLISRLRQMAGGNPEALYARLMQTNPQFAKFIHDNQGKSVQQIAKENGIDYNSLCKFL